MAETEVETILREIRERVLAEQRNASAPAAAPDANNGNRASEVSLAAIEQRPINHDVTSEKLALINSHLVTLSRAWDRLPPVVSNRSGLSARIELWLKRHLKRATRWYAWEQVNFNASVHHAIRDLLQVLTTHQQELEQLEAKHAAERHADSEQHKSEISALRAELEMQQRTGEAQNATIEAQRATMEAQRIEFSAQLSRVLGELRERITLVQEEHRVSFKQLSLETSEAAILEERARRKTEALIEELQLKLKK